MDGTLQQLANVLGMLGSQHAGEVLNAARQAERLRGKLGKSWPEILTGTGHDIAAELVAALQAAAKAEARAKAAEASALGLVGLVTKLREELAALRTPRDPDKTRPTAHKNTGPGYTRSHRGQPEAQPINMRLVERLQLAWCGDEDIRRITGWPPSPVGFRRSLDPIARKNGFVLEIRFRPGSPREYRFVHTDRR
jgi:hypothetical protein